MKFAQINELQRSVNNFLNVDLDFVIKVVSLGKTVQALKREEILQKLLRTNPSEIDKKDKNKKKLLSHLSMYVLAYI